MKILFCGDVVGKAGRRIVFDVVPKLREQLQLDMVIVNGENAAHGFGLSPKIFEEFLRNGTDVVTLGNHAFDKAEIFTVLEKKQNLIRPLNYPENTIGQGWYIHTTASGVRVAVVQLIGRVYMKPVDDPFAGIQNWMDTYQKGIDYDILFVDFHADATAEKNAMGNFLDGRASAVVGTHTHIPTADYRIMPNGTAYMTDVGMCGDYDSVIGMKTEGALARFFAADKRGKLDPAEVKGTFCGVCIEIDEETGKAVKIFPVRLGPALENTHEI